MKDKKILCLVLSITLMLTPIAGYAEVNTDNVDRTNNDIEKSTTSPIPDQPVAEETEEKISTDDVIIEESPKPTTEEESTVNEDINTNVNEHGIEVSPNTDNSAEETSDQPVTEDTEESSITTPVGKENDIDEGTEGTETVEEVAQEETPNVEKFMGLRDAFITDNWLDEHTKEEYMELLYSLSVKDLGEGSEELISSIAVYLNNHVEYMDAKFKFLAQLDPDKLSGELLWSYQRIVNNKKGLVAWYYGKLNSGDYILNPVYLATSEKLLAMKFVSGDTNYDLNEHNEGFININNSSKKVLYKGYIIAPDTDSFEFDMKPSSGTKGNLRLGLKISDIDSGKQISSYDNSDVTWSAGLEKGKLYEATFSIETKQSSDNLPQSIEFQWSSSTLTKQVISGNYLLPIDLEDVNNNFLFSIIEIEPFGDADNDGIPNSWEKYGYVFKQGTLLAYDPAIHDITDMHRSSPVNKSTDGDPFSDLEEVIGKENGVSGPGAHELVAAYPQVVVSLRGFDISLRTTNTITKSTTTNILKVLSNGNKNTLKSVRDNNTTKETTQGVSLATTQGMAYKAGTASYVSAGSTSVSAGYTYKTDDSKTDYVVNITDTQITDEVKKSEMEKSISTSNTIDAATLSLELQAENIGNVPVYNMTPNISVIVGDSVVKTFDVAQTFDLAVGETKVFNNQTITLLENGKRQLNLTINKEVLQQILDGAPVQVQTNRLNGEILIGKYNSEERRGSWEDYTNQVNGVTATIHHEDVNYGLKTYKIYAPQKGAIGTSPMTLPLALEIIYGDAFIHDESGITINGVPLSGIFFTADDPQVIEEFNKSIDNRDTLDLDAITLRPGMSIKVETSTDSQTKPLILNTFYKYGKISATILGNLSAVDTVVANIKIDGEVRTINLDRVPGSKTRYSYEFKDIPYIDVEYNNTIVATDENGNESDQQLYISDILFYREQIERKEFGYGFTMLDSEKEFANKEDVRRYFRDHGNKPLLIRYTDTTPKDNRPITVIVNTESDIDGLRTPSRYSDNYRAYITGIFTKDSNIKMAFTNSMQHNLYVSSAQGKGISSTVYTGEPEAKGYLINFGKNSLDNNTGGTYYVTINGKRLKVHNSDAKDTNNIIMMIPANKEEPDKISISLSKGENTDQRFYIQVIGYLTDDIEEGYFYKDLSSKVDVQTIDIREGEKKISIKDKISGFYDPKYLVLEVERENTKSSWLKTIFNNGETYYFGTDQSANGKRLIIVPINSEDKNTLKINMYSSNGASGNMHIRIVGYYY